MDVIILTADKNAQMLIQALINRIQKTEEISPFTFEVIAHPKHDPGVALLASQYLHLFLNSHMYCIVLFDHEGSGKERIEKEYLEKQIEQDLSKNGWNERNCCIVFKPELETWLWVNEIHIRKLIEWENSINIYEWLKVNQFNFEGNKPLRPKEAFELLLRKQGIARSSSLYSKLASLASYRQCIDTSFIKLKTTLVKWFPPSSTIS